MEPVCPISSRCAAEISALLAPPSPLQVQEYFQNLLSSRKCSGITVKQDDNLEKGVFSTRDFKEEELVLKDHMLVGIQHTSNQIDCFNCCYCFRFVGSIEQQIGRRFDMQEREREWDNFSGYSDACHKMDSSVEEEGTQLGASASSKAKVPLPKSVVKSLLNGELKLPFTEKFPFPSGDPCNWGCGEVYYCSESCGDAAMKSYHSLLCTGDDNNPAHCGALLKFFKHANNTNDIFILAAKAISSTILSYRRLKAKFLQQMKYDTSHVSNHSNFSLLLEAWRPISMGHKKRWWDCIALPDDIDSSDEASFRMQIKELAFESLQLLKEAIFDKECEALFSLEIFGHIIGMFELNNLDLVVASPVEDYFLYIDDLPHPDKEEAEKITQPILDALGEDYSICCQGTAFYPLQSCMNHSCYPNAKAFKRDQDRDGQATIIALRPICKGEEITISYIDEDLPFEERQASLADYGFKCRCPKCIEEEP